MTGRTYLGGGLPLTQIEHFELMARRERHAFLEDRIVQLEHELAALRVDIEMFERRLRVRDHAVTA